MTRRSVGSVARVVLSGLFQLALTAGAVMLLFVVYEVWITNIFADRAQEQIADDLRQDWQTPAPLPPEALPPAPRLGEGFAFLHIPRLGNGYSRAVVEGTDPEELESAPGHYVNSAMPGEQGNFALAGHRVGLGSPFEDLDTLQRGDAVVVETVDDWYVYRVTTSEIVSPSQTSVVAPTPGGALDGPPTGAFLTMTTCHPKFSAKQRLVVHAQLESATSKAQTPAGPAALAESG